MQVVRTKPLGVFMLLSLTAFYVVTLPVYFVINVIPK